MAALPKQRYSPQEYLALDRASEFKHEYVNGEVFMMTGASREHNAITFNIAGALRTQLRGKPCQGYVNDMRVRIEGKRYAYPDVVVVCGTPEFEDAEVDTLLNPTVIIEVLSPSTEAYDRGTKFKKYREMPTLQEIVFVAQDAPHFEHYKRNELGEWVLADVMGLEADSHFPSINCTLHLGDVYDNVGFDAPTNSDEHP
ncbi:MAG: Uma2 family endonuclease [bacterium]|nr:Uma2 family endonuclease [bacterium]